MLELILVMIWDPFTKRQASLTISNCAESRSLFVMIPYRFSTLNIVEVKMFEMHINMLSFTDFEYVSSSKLYAWTTATLFPDCLSKIGTAIAFFTDLMFNFFKSFSSGHNNDSIPGPTSRSIIILQFEKQLPDSPRLAFILIESMPN